jgi:hypothetical protein
MEMYYYKTRLESAKLKVHSRREGIDIDTRLDWQAVHLEK